VTCGLTRGRRLAQPTTSASVSASHGLADLEAVMRQPHPPSLSLSDPSLAFEPPPTSGNPPPMPLVEPPAPASAPPAPPVPGSGSMLVYT
jgi:hypothetical protein